ncbi:MAG: FG-GAP repeat protein, partial [Alphaproteobacteria bacterium]|nr:FG-GAP repeat protein [Alphaproteobacteria bacterium]
LQLGDGDNTLAVDALPSYTWATIYSGSGNDTLNVGGTNGTLDDIDGVLVYYGGTGTDTLNAYANSETEDNEGQLTAINLTGFGMGTNSWLNVHKQQDAMLSIPQGHTPCTEDSSCDAAIYYGERNDADVVSSDVEAVNVYMGSGNDTLRVDGTYSQGVTSIYGGAGDDRFEVEATPWGLHANSLRRVDYVAGPLNVYGEAGDADYVIMNDSGDADANTGIFEGRTLTGLDMAGSITFDTAELLEISLGEQNDTFYLRSAPAGVETRVKLNGGFDTVYVGSAAGTLDDILGSLVIEGNLPFAKDALFINDTGYNGGRTFTVTNDPAAITLIVDDPNNPGQTMPLDLDETTITLNGGGQIKYQTIETLVINAGGGNDTLNLEAPHNDRDPLGGFNATFTFNGGAGNDQVNVGQSVPGGRSVDLVDIFSIFNGQDGNDTILFEHTASLVANTLAFVSKTFTQLFPVQTQDWADIFAVIFNETAADLIATALFTTVALGVVADPNVRVMHMGAHTRDFEHLMFSFGSGDDVFQLDDGTSTDPVIYREALTVNGGAGADTFNVATSYVTTQGMVTLNGGLGDDLAYVDFLESGPASTLSVTYNGGEHDTEGDCLRFVGDGVLSGVYNVSPTQARSGSVSVSPSTGSGQAGSFAFTGVEPLVVNGFGSLEMVGADNITDLAIESIPVADMDLTSLVLHVLLVDGVISWRQQVKLDGISAKETSAYGQALSWDGSTLAVGARRSIVSITDEKPIDRTVVDFVKSSGIAAGQSSLASGTYYVEMRDAAAAAGGGDWEFRLLDWNSADVLVADVTGGASLVTGWQDVPDNKVIDTQRGLLVAFGPVEYNYTAVSGGGAASFNYSVGVYPGVVYVYVESGGTWSEQAKLSADDMAYAGQGFGDSVSLSGNTLVVGAPQDISLGSNAGAAYVFQRGGTDWTQAAKIKASDGAANDRFGSSVATNGSTVVVGAPGDEGNRGAAYAFSSGSWGQTSKLNASDGASGDLFGAAIDYAGTTLVVGAPGDDGSRGSAYVYSGSGASWAGPQKLVSSSLQAGEQFGADVAIDTFIVVGAPGYDYAQKIYDGQGLCTRGCDSGAAFVFTGSCTSWSLSARLTASGGLPANLAQNEGRAYDHFGKAVTTSGYYVVVGAPDYDDVSINQGAIYFFEYLPDLGSGAGYSWIRSQNKLVSNTPTENDYFGGEVALNGGRLAVGVPGFNEIDANNNILRENVGTVRFFETNGVISLNNPDDPHRGLYRAEVLMDAPLGSGQAGYEIFYHPGSRTLLVGAPTAGYVYVYADEGLYWNHYQSLGWSGQMGYDMDIYGDTLVVGAPGSSYVHVYTFNYGSRNWDHRASIGGPSGSEFGKSVSIEDGR